MRAHARRRDDTASGATPPPLPASSALRACAFCVCNIQCTRLCDQVGILFREASVHGGAQRGFLARPVAGKYVGVDASRAGDAMGGLPYRTKLTTLCEFQLVGNVRRDADGCIIGAVDVS